MLPRSRSRCSCRRAMGRYDRVPSELEGSLLLCDAQLEQRSSEFGSTWRNFSLRTVASNFLIVRVSNTDASSSIGLGDFEATRLEIVVVEDPEASISAVMECRHPPSLKLNRQGCAVGHFASRSRSLGFGARRSSGHGRLRGHGRFGFGRGLSG